MDGHHDAEVDRPRGRAGEAQRWPALLHDSELEYEDLVERRGMQLESEGCLSVPGYYDVFGRTWYAGVKIGL